MTFAASGRAGPMTFVASASMPVVHRLPAPIALVLGMAALAVVAVPEFWSLVCHVGVIAHEGAHAVVGSCLDTRVESVRLNSDGTGATVIRRARGSGVLTGFAGYLGPSIFGLGAALLIAHDQIDLVLWAGVVLLAIMLPSVRNVFGIAVVIGTGFVLFSIARSGQAGLEAAAAYGLTWLLLLSGVRSVLDHGAEAVDAYKLREITSLPRGLWHQLWLFGTVLALGIGCTLLV